MKNMIIALLLTLGTLTVATPAEANTYPACGKIWVVGQKLPLRYKGCETRTTIYPAIWVRCADGTKMTTFRDRKWAKAGRKIYTGTQQQYSNFYYRCKG